MKVAIIGAGPRGLWAAEELMERARQRGARIELSVLNDAPLDALSAPDAFRPDTPEQWLLNVPSGVIETRLSSFNTWRGADDDFPSRRTVGQFLLASWEALRENLPRGCTLEMIERKVSNLTPVDGGVVVEGELFAEVLLCTGHAPAEPVVGAQSAYPHTNLDSIGRGDVLLVRGAALSFMDVVRYVPARRIYPVTRTGRFMEVKAYPEDEAARASALAPHAEEIRRCEGFDQFRAILTEAAQTILRAQGGDGDVAAVIDGTDFTGDAVAELRTSLAAAEATRPWTAALAVGYTFRTLYPQIIRRASFGGRDTLGGERFYRLTRVLERVAFGPPADTARDLVEALDSGRVRVDVMQRGDQDLRALAAEVGADVIVDSVTAPAGVVPGTLVGFLVEAGIGQTYTNTGNNRALRVEPDGTLVGQKHLAAAGRMSEGWILGHDTLRRSEDDVIPAWAKRVSAAAMVHPQRVHGTPPLTARTEGWVDELLADPERCQSLLDTYSSPVNILNPEPMVSNIDELVQAGADCGVEVKVFFARKANKGIAFVDTVRDAGHGVDVASYDELRQVLMRGVPGERIIVSAAIKTDHLLRLAIESGVVISADNRDEYDRIVELAGGNPAYVAPRLAPDPAMMPPTRFGERLDTWKNHLARPVEGVKVVGVHAHLHGYAAADRAAALRECMELTDSLRAAGHVPEFIDIGGGVPMSYLDDAEQWEDYCSAISTQRAGYAAPFTWKSDPLSTHYPFHQQPTRGAWLQQVLSDGIAEALSERGLRLHLEPGRSLLDGCGLILAQVAFVKTRSDGLPLVGLHMNRTQCRTTSDDYLVDPILVKRTPDSAELEAFLVGAYCIEDEVILRRRIRFPRGVSAGDIIAIPNTAGYFMHILESASHQIPLAKNVDWPAGTLDAIDQLDQVDQIS
ncbi:diaminopimelate decarboxylase [Corynebacterium yudongzhengii]|uniref:Diaminopimelate decarboxylase n=1 Tax=Corynebacterium yudongzhengii TaxID=2080740 RepID=A0A2U1T650_9CORY|nr:FAD/NAD(P)-binding protein [Corynebacterium yudongzhengii]AWB82014.1 diaminopimelate decarboxylase [Corynebacterium yudongzhengii]PWC01476.1 diaminopimelate decarboxylase [Corynebacterium yudongzhengii]